MSFPSADSFHSYEQLGIVGILLLVLLAGIMIFLWVAMKVIWLSKAFVQALGKMSDAHLTAARETVSVLSGISGNQDRLVDLVTEHHHRLDDLLSCPTPECPAKPRKLTQPPSFLKMSQQPM